MTTELKEHEEGTATLPNAPSAELVQKEPKEVDRQQSVAEPYEVPFELFDQHKDLIIEFLDKEFEQCDAERTPMMRKIARWKQVYAAPAASEPKHFPIWNSSNLTIPVVKEMVNTLAAQLVQSTLTATPRWIMQDLAAEFEPFTDEIERFMDIASNRDLKLDETAVPWIIETAKLGTGIMATEHRIEVRKNYKYSLDGKKVYKSDDIVADGPFTYFVPLSKFWIRPHEPSIQQARWCATQHEFQWWNLKERAARRQIRNLEELKKWKARGTVDRVEATDQKLAEYEPKNHEPYELFWVYLFWDIDNDGFQEHLKILYSREAKQILSCKFFPYWHNKRPFTKIGYFPRPDRGFYDEGLCEMLEDLQAGISDKHNKRSDNEALANLKMILKRKMVKGLQPGDPLYTGKIVEVNDIWNDIREWQLSEIYPSTVQAEQIQRQYAERLAGSNEATAGAAMPVTRTTMGAQLALLQEQAKRIDVAVRSIRGGLNEIGQITLHLYHQFGTNGKAIAWMGEKGRIVEGVLRLPRHVHELGLAISASTPTSTLNRQVKSERSLQLLQLLIQVHEKLWPFAQALAPDAMGQVAHGMVSSARRFLSDTLEAHESSDPEAILAGLAVLEKVLPPAGDFGGMESFERRAESAAILDKLGSLEGLLSEVKTTRERGDGVTPRSRNGTSVPVQEGIPGGRTPSFRLGGPPDSR